MAINPILRYGGQVFDNRVGYPYGSARNKSTPTDTNGTPLERMWVNDIWGFQQALLNEAGIVPTNSPDRVGASQYLQAIQAIIRAEIIATQPTRVTVPLVLGDNPGGVWEFNENNLAYFTLRQANAMEPGVVRIAFSLPYVGMRLKTNAIKVWLQGASGHAAVPGLVPHASLGVRPGTAILSPVELVDSFPDQGHTVETYEQVHQLNLPSAARDIDPADQYFVNIYGEAWDNALPGLELIRVSVEMEQQG